MSSSSRVTEATVEAGLGKVSSNSGSFVGLEVGVEVLNTLGIKS